MAKPLVLMVVVGVLLTGCTGWPTDDGHIAG